MMPGIVIHACHPNSWEADTRGSVVQDWPQLRGKFEVSLGYMRSHFEQMTTKGIK